MQMFARGAPWAALALALAAVAGPAGSGPSPVSDKALIEAAKQSRLSLIDYGEESCRNDRSIETWLMELAGDQAGSVRWSAGRCQLVNDLNPLDAGGEVCVQAQILLKRPLNRRDRPMIEIFLKPSSGGRPGKAYAFRADLEGSGLLRFRRDFEAAWVERFPAAAAAVACDDPPY